MSLSPSHADSAGHLGTLDRPETSASSDVHAEIGDAERMLYAFMGETGIQPVASPREGHSPPSAAGMDTMADRQVMDLYAELVEWRSHAVWKIEHHSNRVQYAERNLTRRLGDAASASSERTVAAAEREARQTRDVRRAEDRLDDERATLRYWRAAEKTLGERLHVVNREVSMRIAVMPSQARGAGFTP